MTRQEFLHRLWELLADVTQEERDEALRFYNEYFDEAGPEQEQELLKELGSPKKVASIIKANVPGSSAQPRYYSPMIAKPVPAYAGPQPSYTDSEADQNPVSGKAKNNNWVWVMIVALIVLAPAIIGIVSGLIGLVLGLLGACAGLFVGGIVSVACGIVAIVKSALGISLGAGTALMTAGFGFLDLAAGLGMLALGLWVVFWLIPGLWKGIKWCWNKVVSLVRGNVQ